MTWTITAVVMRAVTSNIAEPPQVVVPSVAVAVIEMLKPFPAGSPPMVVDSVELFATLIVPVLVNPLGPVIA